MNDQKGDPAMSREVKIIKAEIEGNVTYKSVVSNGTSSAELDIDHRDEEIGFLISVMFSNIKSFLEMIYVQATHEPESLSPATILEIGNRLIDTYDNRVSEIMEHLEARVGKISIVCARKGNGHIDAEKILDILLEQDPSGGKKELKR